MISTRCGGIFDLPHKLARVEELRRKLEPPELWEEPRTAAKLNQQVARLEEELAGFSHLEAEHRAALEMFDLLVEEGLEEANPDYEAVAESLVKLSREVERAGVLALLSEEHDHLPAIVTIHAGAGGTESHDWVNMLVRMYLGWAEASGHSVRILSELPGAVAGTKAL